MGVKIEKIIVWAMVISLVILSIYVEDWIMVMVSIPSLYMMAKCLNEVL